VDSEGRVRGVRVEVTELAEDKESGGRVAVATGGHLCVYVCVCVLLCVCVCFCVCLCLWFGVGGWFNGCMVWWTSERANAFEMGRWVGLDVIVGG